MKTKNRSRNTYLDWLRVLGTLFGFIYHSTRLYNVEDWQQKCLPGQNPLLLRENHAGCK